MRNISTCFLIRRQIQEVNRDRNKRKKALLFHTIKAIFWGRKVIYAYLFNSKKEPQLVEVWETLMLTYMRWYHDVEQSTYKIIMKQSLEAIKSNSQSKSLISLICVKVQEHLGALCLWILFPNPRSVKWCWGCSAARVSHLAHAQRHSSYIKVDSVVTVHTSSYPTHQQPSSPFLTVDFSQ